MKKIKSVGNSVENIEVEIWNLEAKLLNSGLLFKNDAVIKALHDAGTSLYNYRISKEVA